jgi:cell division transport system ATP-binding protein
MKFILNTVILLLLPHKQKLIMSQAVLSLKNVTIYQEDNVNINLR